MRTKSNCFKIADVNQYSEREEVNEIPLNESSKKKVKEFNLK